MILHIFISLNYSNVTQVIIEVFKSQTIKYVFDNKRTALKLHWDFEKFFSFSFLPTGTTKVAPDFFTRTLVPFRQSWVKTELSLSKQLLLDCPFLIFFVSEAAKRDWRRSRQPFINDMNQCRIEYTPCICKFCTVKLNCIRRDFLHFHTYLTLINPSAKPLRQFFQETLSAGTESFNHPWFIIISPIIIISLLALNQLIAPETLFYCTSQRTTMPESLLPLKTPGA